MPAFIPESWRRELPSWAKGRQPGWDVEDRIVARLVFDLLAYDRRWYISVFDGESVCQRKTRNPHAILGALYSTDEDTLHIYVGNRCIGWVRLIGGNVQSIISDWAPGRDDSAISKAVEGAMKIANEYV